jgi:sec-independent protein translocase protein TatA
MFENIGAPELLLILIIVFLLFGIKKIPDIAKGLGQGIREFRKAMRDIHEEVDKEQNQPDKKSDKDAKS